MIGGLAMPAPRSYRAGQSIEDYCRACKTDRMHTVIAADDSGQPIRVACGYCRSEHNYRGGPRVAAGLVDEPRRDEAAAAPGAAREPRRGPSTREPFPLVSDRDSDFYRVVDHLPSLDILAREPRPQRLVTSHHLP